MWTSLKLAALPATHTLLPVLDSTALRLPAEDSRRRRGVR